MAKKDKSKRTEKMSFWAEPKHAKWLRKEAKKMGITNSAFLEELILLWKLTK